MKNIHFSLIRISGFRGRNFTLKMNPRGQNTIFVMDGNTGKTTTIELLRWCFKYPESECIGKFSHMWVDSAHLLDESKTTPQYCEIIIQFKALDENKREHTYQFTRSVSGISERDYISSPEKLNSDTIRDVHDSLEIDHGSKIITGDNVNEFLEQEFRLKDCADFFCFDGEKAREIMQLSSNTKSIGALLTFVDQRATHPMIEEYRDRLNGLKNRVLEEANTKVSDKAQELLISRLRKRLEDQRDLERERDGYRIDQASNSLVLKNLQNRSNDLQNKITKAKADEIVQKLRFELDIEKNTKAVNDKRSNIYALALQWIYGDDAGLMNALKAQVRERGDLPEPYRKNLISKCLASNKCEVCGRTLDDPSKKYILALQQVVAATNVHAFLTDTLTNHASTLDPEQERKTIKSLIDDCKRIETEMNNIKLSDEDKRLFAERDLVQEEIRNLLKKDANLQAKIDEHDTWIVAVKKEINELQGRNSILRSNKFIIDKIDEALDKVEVAEKAIKAKTIDIISNVISENVSQILGDKFAAKLTVKDGLMLGEGGYFGRERGGYSGRLILSYCFAEAMTLIDPIIVDTPSGNVGTHREKLARHLVTNHKQIILLCLPTEIADFGPYISSNPITIVNSEAEQ